MNKLKNNIVRVALIGPESTGKSTLAEQLAVYFKTVWVPEYSRTYISNLNRKPEPTDIIKIYQKQMEIENELISKADKVIFTDTECINGLIWYHHLTGEFCESLEKSIINNSYDLYLLTKPDIEWHHDPLREHPHLREYFFSVYKAQLNKRSLEYVTISGRDEQRIDGAIQAIEQLLKSIG